MAARFNLPNNIITIKDRKSRFAESLKPFLELYGKDMLNDFYEYWTEHGDNDRKMRFEKKKSFDVSKRLVRWNKNSFKNKEKSSAKKESINDPKIGRMNQETLQSNYNTILAAVQNEFGNGSK